MRRQIYFVLPLATIHSPIAESGTELMAKERTTATRIGRVVSPDFPHPVVPRGHDRNVVLPSDADFHYYLNTLGQVQGGVRCPCARFLSDNEPRASAAGTVESRRACPFDETPGRTSNPISQSAVGSKRKAFRE